jgi:hypothetical protein
VAITLQQYMQRMREVRIQEMRPSVFRQIFAGSTGTPMVETLDDLVEEIVDTEIQPYGEMKVIQNTTTNVKMTTFDSTKTTSNARTAAIGYEILTEQLNRLDANNIPIRKLFGLANFKIAEKWLEDANLLGSTQYGFGSLLKNTNVTFVTLGTKTTGGTAWTAATPFEEIVKDILAISQAVFTNSFQTLTGDTVLLPNTAYDIGVNTVHATSGISAIEAAKQRDVRIKRVMPLTHLVGAGAGATNRAMGLCSTGTVVQMSERAFREEPPRQIDLGSRIIETVRTAGAIWNNLQGAVYADGM